MTEHRRYDEDEVRRIFELASEEGTPPGGSDGSGRSLAPEGMTLSELQAIGREVGIAEGAVARAAAHVRADIGLVPRTRIAGVPIAVGRTVNLPGRLSEEAWELLVVDLRRTFQAPGHTYSEGSLRQWTNGNLQIMLEPTEAGYQLRMRTDSGRLRAQMSLGAAMTGLGGMFFLLESFGRISEGPGLWLTCIILGVAAMVAAVVGGPSWAGTREQQFAEIAARATDLAHGSRDEVD